MPSTPEYREWVEGQGLVSYTVSINESDLYIATETDLSGEALRALRHEREVIENYIRSYPQFAVSLVPLTCKSDAPAIIRDMTFAATAAGVGPMAAVAGAIAAAVGGELAKSSREVIIENGGDIYLYGFKRRVIAIYAGDSPLSGRVGLEVELRGEATGVCTSSGTVGHSLSFGRADAAVALAASAALADAAATAIGNRVVNASDIEAGLEIARGITGVTGAVIIIGEHIGAWGDITLTRLSCAD